MHTFLVSTAAITVICLGAPTTAAAGATPAIAQIAQVPGTDIYGSGSALQTSAQLGGAQAGLPAAYDGLENAWNANAATSQSGLSGGPFISQYTGIQSGEGVAEFGNAPDPAGCPIVLPFMLDIHCDTNPAVQNELDSYIGSDIPPTVADLDSGRAASGSPEETVPIYQAPISLMLSLPTDMSLGQSAKVKLTTTDVENIYSGTVPANAGYPANSWGALLTQADGGSATNTPITAVTGGTPNSDEFLDRGSPASSCQDTDEIGIEDGGYTCINLEVSDGDSGTTYALQGFLYETGAADYPLSAVTGDESWPAGVTYDDGTAAHPDPFSGAADVIGTNVEVSTLVKNTLAIPGSIGYADEADAILDAATDTQPVANSFYSQISGPNSNWTSDSRYDLTQPHQIIEAEVQNDEAAAKPKFAFPGAVNYTNPAADTITTDMYDGAHINQTGAYNSAQTSVGDWSYVSNPYGGASFGGTIASDPVVNGHGGSVADYPIVAATYDAGWEQYDTPTLAAPGLGSGGYNGLADAQAVGATTGSYLVWLAGSFGQASIASSRIGIQKLPTPIDTRAKAQAALVNSLS